MHGQGSADELYHRLQRFNQEVAATVNGHTEEFSLFGARVISLETEVRTLYTGSQQVLSEVVSQAQGEFASEKAEVAAMRDAVVRYAAEVNAGLAAVQQAVADIHGGAGQEFRSL